MQTEEKITKEEKLDVKKNQNKRVQESVELAGEILLKANIIATKEEKRIQSQIASMIEDPDGKVFTTSFTDQCFRSNSNKRAANQLLYILNKYGVPNFLPRLEYFGLSLLKSVGKLFPSFFIFFVKLFLRKETSKVIIPGENAALLQHIKSRKKEGVNLNLNHLGEAILGEEEAKRRLSIYLEDLSKPEVEYVSIKVSTIFSQINLLAREESLKILSERLRLLYREAKKYDYVRLDGKKAQKFVNLDMEEYRDLQLTVDLFCSVLAEPEFLHYYAGIVLQCYLPDSYFLLQKLTDWSIKRVGIGGAPIKVRLVKGANLSMEQVESSMKGWAQAPYTTKVDVDKNFKRLLHYSCTKERLQAVHLGVASHNLFDISYAFLLRKENNFEKYISFEMLEGMVDSTRKVVQDLSNDMLLYCPISKKEDFHHAISYLMRRLDENTAPNNFLRESFGLVPGSRAWKKQEELFKSSFEEMDNLPSFPRRGQNRFKEHKGLEPKSDFLNESDTDWALVHNVDWIKEALEKRRKEKRLLSMIPSVIGGEELTSNPNREIGKGIDPSEPSTPYYIYIQANAEDIERSLQTAQEVKKDWAETSLEHRCKIFIALAKKFREKRGDLIAIMVADGAKSSEEADVEVSEAIDFIEYYWRSLKDLSALSDIDWKAKGVVLVTPPWNFPCAISVGGIVSSLIAGNAVIYKPAKETILVAWELISIFWSVGISKKVLQFVCCEDNPEGSSLVSDSRVDTVILTGATETAKLFYQLKPEIDLCAETGGKNAIIVTAMADRDLAVRDIVQSAFFNSGQKCSACSLLICEDEVYDDLSFRRQLKDAVESLFVGSAWDLRTKINPLVLLPNKKLLRGLTTLEAGEEWLLKPKQDKNNPHLWSPGIKLGVRKGGFTHKSELFGPVLGIMRASNLSEAIDVVNKTSYGLTSGLHSLDEREISFWLERILAGNCYVNRGITGAVVQRQPFGGIKESSFGMGLKAGGPNYLRQLMIPKQKKYPKEQAIFPSSIKKLNSFLLKSECHLKEEEKQLWSSSISSYSFYYQEYFNKDHDPSLVIGQDNYLRYISRPSLEFRIQEKDTLIDIFRVLAGAIICGITLNISLDSFKKEKLNIEKWEKGQISLAFFEESENDFIKRISNKKFVEIRVISPIASNFLSLLNKGVSKYAFRLLKEPVLANGRVELLNYLREMSISIDYHRYGNLGDRENQKRAPLFEPELDGI